MKRIIASIIAILTVLSLVACQSTPEEVIVVKKDTERMLEQAGMTEDGTAVSALGIPRGKYIYEAADTSNRLHIKADAKVIVPEVEQLPVARVSKGRFSYRDMENFSRLLGAGSIPISLDTPFPKEYYRPQLNHLMEMRQNGRLDKYASMEELDNAIRELMDKMEQAPETAQAIEHDLSFKPMENGGETVNLRWMRSNAVLASLSVVNDEQGAGSYAEYLRDVTRRAEFSTLTAQGLSVTLNYEQTRNPNFKKPAISETDAMNIAQAAIDGLDLKDFVCTGKRMAALYNSTIAAEDGERQGLYEFMFTRSVNGTAITYTNEDIAPRLSLFLHFFHQVNAQQADEQRPDDILVHGIEPCSAVHQVEGYLRKQRKDQHPQGIALEAPRVEIALHRHKGEHRESKPSHACEPLLRRQKRCPQVIHQHEGHRQNMQRRRAKIKPFFHQLLLTTACAARAS